MTQAVPSKIHMQQDGVPWDNICAVCTRWSSFCQSWTRFPTPRAPWSNLQGNPETREKDQVLSPGKRDIWAEHVPWTETSWLKRLESCCSLKLTQEEASDVHAIIRVTHGYSDKYGKYDEANRMANNMKQWMSNKSGDKNRVPCWPSSAPKRIQPSNRYQP